MSRSARQKRARCIVVRSKRAFPTQKRAMKSLRFAGIMENQLKTPKHTGTYWRWEIAR